MSDDRPGSPEKLSSEKTDDDAVPSVEPNDLYATRKRPGLANAARSMSPKSATTLFQPGVMADTDLDADDQVPSSATFMLEGPPRTPPLRTRRQPYFLVVGALAGEERLALTSSRTVFGRDEGDVKLADAAVSGKHFQIDVVGEEFFVKDLGSRNGTQLNGHPVRYAELLPGDEVRAGETVLIFRLEGDGLSGRD
jgi:FHA domain